MIVNKNNKITMTRSDMPNINWLDDDWYVVEDNSFLANKIKILTPRYNFVLDEEGNLIDVEEIPKTEQEIKQEEIKSIDEELKEIDNSTGLTRIMEDIITHTGIYLLMYDSTKEIIEKKKALREKRNKLVKEIGGM